MKKKTMFFSRTTPYFTVDKYVLNVLDHHYLLVKFVLLWA